MSEEKPIKKETEKEEKIAEKGTILNYINSCDKLNIISILVVILAVATILIIGIDECKRCLDQKSNILQAHHKTPRKKFWSYGRNIESGYLKHVFAVLDRLGYENDPDSNDWDLLWAHDYPFRAFGDKLRNLKSHQKVNHFPGSGYLTNKVDLATSNLSYIPKAFKLPKEKEKLIQFASENHKRKFVFKNNEHRKVQVKKLEDVDLNINDTFVQEFIDNPLLVNGHMFDIGIYVVITSIDPLRLYIYNGDFLLRFCPEVYHPFDPNNLNKYVVGDDYLPIWEVPEINFYYNNLGLGMRDSLSAYLKNQGKDPSILWKQIDDSLMKIVMGREHLLAKIVKQFKYKHNFFEMMRFDFIADENLNIYLLEANMSPNLSSAHFKPNQLLYEQVIFNLFSLVGVAERVKKDSLAVRSTSEETMQSAYKNIAVIIPECKTTCRDNCHSFECELCKPCMSEEMRDEFLRAHREHLNRADCKRIFPPSMKQNADEYPIDFQEYTTNNKLMYKWFNSKCKTDSTWC